MRNKTRRFLRPKVDFVCPEARLSQPYSPLLDPNPLLTAKTERGVFQKRSHPCGIRPPPNLSGFPKQDSPPRYILSDLERKESGRRPAGGPALGFAMGAPGCGVILPEATLLGWCGRWAAGHVGLCTPPAPLRRRSPGPNAGLPPLSGVTPRRMGGDGLMDEFPQRQCNL